MKIKIQFQIKKNSCQTLGPASKREVHSHLLTVFVDISFRSVGRAVAYYVRGPRVLNGRRARIRSLYRYS
jgi:hypothetical protein